MPLRKYTCSINVSFSVTNNKKFETQKVKKQSRREKYSVSIFKFVMIHHIETIIDKCVKCNKSSYTLLLCALKVWRLHSVTFYSELFESITMRINKIILNLRVGRSSAELGNKDLHWMVGALVAVELVCSCTHGLQG